MRLILSKRAGLRPPVLMRAVALLALGGCTAWTRPFTDQSGAVIPGSIAEMGTATLGGVKQAIWIRGRDSTAPPLILLHGGPGATEAPLFRRYDAGLERDFLVVYWEQRGTGRSYHDDIPRSSMTIARIESDLDQLVDLVRARFHHRRVVLLAHSWGTIIGTRYAYHNPEKVAAYVGIAQIANFAQGERMSYEWALGQATARDDPRVLRALQEMAPGPSSVDDELALGKIVERYGGSLRGGLSTGKLIWAALRTDEATLIDLVKFGQGNLFSLTALRPEYSRADLTTMHRFAVPMVFMLGRYDWHVPSVLAARWFGTIEAPAKRLIWFEQSAHNPPFAQPGAFLRAMRTYVLPLARDGTAAAADEPAR